MGEEERLEEIERALRQGCSNMEAVRIEAMEVRQVNADDERNDTEGDSHREEAMEICQVDADGEAGDEVGCLKEQIREWIVLE